MKLKGRGGIGFPCVIALLSMTPAKAAAIYTAEGVAAGGAGFSYEQKSSGTALADTGAVFNNPIGGSVARAGAIASQYGVGAFSEISVFWFGHGVSSQGLGRATTDVIFTGPVTGAPIPVSINFIVDGGFGGGYATGQSSTRWIDMNVTLYSSSAFGRVGEEVNDGVPIPILVGDLAPAGLACLAAGCPIESPVFFVPANTPMDFTMQLTAYVIAGWGVGTASFENTFYFPLDRNVFNLPEGYTAEMPGLSVYNNRVVLPGGSGEVPEPGTFALMGASLALAAVLRRGRKLSR